MTKFAAGSPQLASPIKGLLCPSRRTTTVGPKVDYATARNLNLAMNATVGVNPARQCSSILSYNANTPAALRYTGTNIGAVTNADGTSNTLLLSHKSMRTTNYSSTAATNFDRYWADLANPATTYDHQRLVTTVANNFNATPPQQDSSLATYNEQVFGSPHSGAMPSLYADGSVRNFAYTSTASIPGVAAAMQPGQVWALLWTWNDSVALNLR